MREKEERNSFFKFGAFLVDVFFFFFFFNFKRRKWRVLILRLT